MIVTTQLCEMCEKGSASLSYQVEHFPYGSGTERTTLAAHIPVFTCDTCGSQYAGEGAEDNRHEAVCAHLGRLAPKQIRKIRETYNLSQEAWALATGIGLASVKRWETGAKIQNESADVLMRLLQHPDVFQKLSSIKRYSETARKGPTFRTELSLQTQEEAKIFRLRPPSHATDLAAA